MIPYDWFCTRTVFRRETGWWDRGIHPHSEDRWKNLGALSPLRGRKIQERKTRLSPHWLCDRAYRSGNLSPWLQSRTAWVLWKVWIFILWYSNGFPDEKTPKGVGLLWKKFYRWGNQGENHFYEDHETEDPLYFRLYDANRYGLRDDLRRPRTRSSECAWIYHWGIPWSMWEIYRWGKE